MKSTHFTPYLAVTGFLFLCICFILFSGYKPTPQTVSTQPAFYPIAEIDTKPIATSTILYNPQDNHLVSIKNKKGKYSLHIWQQNQGWSTAVASWKINKADILDNFTYSLTGDLFCCLKKFKKGILQSQDIVQLKNGGTIKSLSLIGLESTSFHKKEDTLPEICDIECHKTSLAVTYQYGAVKIYNIKEKQALGANTMFGDTKRNAFYNMNYFTITKDSSTENVLLHKYDVRSGEIIYSFSLGGNGQDRSDFAISNYKNNIVLLTPHGIYTGSCDNNILTKQLSYTDLQLPKNHQIRFLQAARDNICYIGYVTSDKTYHLRQINLSEVHPE